MKGQPTEPGSPLPTPRRRSAFVPFLAVVIAVILLVGSGTARAAWQEIAEFLSLFGDPEPASANVLSEHEIEALDQMEPQHQAELLLERSINHYRGANEQIAARVENWRDRLEMEGRLDMLFKTALNSSDLRVRAASIEVNIVARKLEKAVTTVDRLEPVARHGEQGPRANALWDLGLLGNRGIDPSESPRSSCRLFMTTTSTFATGRSKVLRTSEPMP
jgi:hypothetical protein